MEIFGKMFTIQEPENLKELHEVFVKSLRAIRLLDKRTPKSISISRQRHWLVFRANLPELNKRNIRVDFGSDILSLRRHSEVILAVEIKAFSHSATFKENQLELKLAEHQLSEYWKNILSMEASAETCEAVWRVLKTAEQPLRKVFITRALNAVAHLSEGMKDIALETASAAPSDFSVLV
ncbi:MAG: hypothetical protein ACREX3_10710, partial [Gammaproteobacteria bacterium]